MFVSQAKMGDLESIIFVCIKKDMFSPKLKNDKS